ncbi:NADH oxidase, partial [Mycoplasmopsis synoviae]
LKNVITNDYAHVALATNAVKTGIVAALHLAGMDVKFPAVVRTNAVSVFDCKYGSTGFTKRLGEKNGVENLAEVYFEDNDRPEFMAQYEKVACKIV